MKVILNQDVKHLGEEGDIKDVAKGYARNYLFPRNLALPLNDMTVAYFEERRNEIEVRKLAKRTDSTALKERLEAADVTLIMPAGVNGKLYGAVTSLSIAELLSKLGFEIERKRIDIPGLTIKAVGNYPVSIRLYESVAASIVIHVKSQVQAESDAAVEKKAALAKSAAETQKSE